MNFVILVSIEGYRELLSIKLKMDVFRRLIKILKFNIIFISSPLVESIDAVYIWGEIVCCPKLKIFYLYIYKNFQNYN